MAKEPSIMPPYDGQNAHGRLNTLHPGPTKPKYLRTGIAVDADRRNSAPGRCRPLVKMIMAGCLVAAVACVIIGSTG